MHGKPDTKNLLIAQVFITFFMSGTMSAFMGILHMGFSDTFLSVWPRDWAIAWPVAFLFTQVYGPLGFKLSFMVRKPKA